MSLDEVLSLFPVTASVSPDGRLFIAGHDVEQLARQYGTPLYVYDAETVRYQISSLQNHLKKLYSGDAAITYAVKAYFSLEFARRLQALNVGADVVSLGEMMVAHQAGFSPNCIHMHGNNKTETELRAAINWGIQAIVVDSLDELSFLETIAAEMGKRTRIWLRITPDLRVNTHPHIETSTSDSKFGLHMQNGQASDAIRRALASPWLELVGLHTHLGSQLFDPEPYRRAIEMLFELAESERFIPEEVSPGGGWGVRYVPSDAQDDCRRWVATVAEAVEENCRRLGWPLPKLILEPGRWIVARSGTAIYRAGNQKKTVSNSYIIAVDGGMADNPRTALYQAQYTAKVVQRFSASAENNVRIVGKYCESGDVLIPDVQLPEVHRGDLIAIPVSGAYQLSMSSNYNLADRPAVLWLEKGKVEILQQREIPQDAGWWSSPR